MFALVNTQAALVDAFMVIAGYNDTNHPAVRLVDLYLNEHPELITFTKYAATWLLLNLLTAILVIYIAAKIAILTCGAIYELCDMLAYQILRARHGAKVPPRSEWINIKAEMRSEAKATTKSSTTPSTASLKDERQVQEQQPDETMRNFSSATGLDSVRANTSPSTARRSKATLRPKRSRIYEWDTSDDEDFEVRDSGALSDGWDSYDDLYD